MKLTERWEERLARALRKEFDRAFAVTVEKDNGKVRITVTDQDSGEPVIMVGDVACLLQLDRTRSERQHGQSDALA